MPSRWCVFMRSIYQHLLPLRKQLISKGHKKSCSVKVSVMDGLGKITGSLSPYVVTAWQAWQRWGKSAQGSPFPTVSCHTCSWAAWPLEHTSWTWKCRPHRWLISREFWMPDHIGSPRLAEKEESPSPMVPSPLFIPQGEYRPGQAPSRLLLDKLSGLGLLRWWRGSHWDVQTEIDQV